MKRNFLNHGEKPMKLDGDYIEEILKAVEAHPKSRMEQSDLLQAIGADRNNEDDKDKFYYHMMRIEEAGYMTSPSENFGFSPRMGGWSLLGTDYELTWSGVRFLGDMLRP
jgi:hypothetical protein